MDKIRTARKDHRCENGCLIRSGSQYLDRRIRSRQGEAFRFCLPCASSRQEEDDRERLHQESMDTIDDKDWAR